MKKVLLIGLDGVRVDILAQAATPNIDALIASGAFSDRAQTRPPTVSGPGWSSMLTGVWSEKHLVTGNNFEGNAYHRYPDFLTRLEQVKPELNTFAVLDWPPLGTTASGGPLVSDTVDVKLNFDGDELGYTEADQLSLTSAIEHLSNEDPDAAFVYLGDIDVVGHDYSSLAREYQAAIETADGQVGELLDAIRNRPNYDREDWLIIVSTDHGRTDAGGHGGESPQERTIFYLVSGESAQKGELSPAPNIVDVAVTALSHLEVEVDLSWELDGSARGLAQRD
ncbi:MAG: alkaline phosphatase family protein [Gemmatimonadota bacterium]|nr:MAG: alkaline phosphatase family protein [Gemmatimonadota bacterium]